MKVIAIDPGMNTGIAYFENGKLVQLTRLRPLPTFLHLDKILPDYGLCVLEDSRLQSAIFQENAKKFTTSKAMAMSIARDVGTIDAWCHLIQSLCEHHKVELVSVSPLKKGSKLKDLPFRAKTGWEGRTSQDCRDAATVGWIYRNLRLVQNRVAG